ncbi:MAG: helix-turn-helix domain-containing protein [Bacteroidales bacterium]|nr:helix-turn-helix domain-containing protein [Bacteroidales bacterium]
MRFDVEKFKSLVEEADPKIKAEDDFVLENIGWIGLSLKVAIRARSVMREKGITQVQLAAWLNVTKAQISKFLSGKENLTLSTIDKLQQALGENLISIPSTQSKNLQTSEPVMS